MRGRSGAALAAVGLLLLAGFAYVGCGDDEEDDGLLGGSGGATAPQPTRTVPPPEKTETEPAAPETEPAAPETEPPEPAAPEPSPEEQPGGAGDEEPVRSEAMFTGRGGRIAPREVRVPPFIAIRITLRSADRGEYVLRFPGVQLRTGPGRSSDSATVDGLRHGERIVGRLVGAGGSVAIEASAEPGP